MLDNFSLLNPLKPIVTPEDASTAARAGAVGAFLTVISGVYGAVQVYLKRDQLVAIARQSAEVSVSDPEVARQTAAMMEGVATTLPLVMSGIVVLIYLVFGLVQWRKRTMVIPLLMFLFSAYGVVMGLIGLLGRGSAAQAQYQAFLPPVWQQVAGWLLSVVILALFWAGYRGGDRLKKIGAAPDVSTF